MDAAPVDDQDERGPEAERARKASHGSSLRGVIRQASPCSPQARPAPRPGQAQGDADTEPGPPNGHRCACARLDGRAAPWCAACQNVPDWLPPTGPMTAPPHPRTALSPAARTRVGRWTAIRVVLVTLMALSAPRSGASAPTDSL